MMQPVAASNEIVNPITKLPPAKRPFDVDFSDNERQYVSSEESEELRQFLQKVRDLCFEKIAKDPELYYPQDVEKLKTKEWVIRRYMVHMKGDKLKSEDPVKTSELIIKMMQWKRKMNLRGKNCVDV